MERVAEGVKGRAHVVGSGARLEAEELVVREVVEDVEPGGEGLGGIGRGGRHRRLSGASFYPSWRRAARCIASMVPGLGDPDELKKRVRLAARLHVGREDLQRAALVDLEARADRHLAAWGRAQTHELDLAEERVVLEERVFSLRDAHADDRSACRSTS